ncbi:MAG TPA: sigma-70 family RNA polymerase sigma factor [Steroidobacteraceae bacterium]|jgi:RNA polymerase sigma-70 factor (ECF subfamily)|nr:sigma-70 family RNA polymerase sigma factor [Steroidobacteraceae bacterium]
MSESLFIAELNTEAELRSLMVAALRGDGNAHCALLKRLAVKLRSFFGRRLGRDAADVEDLVQEVLIAVHTRRDTYDTERPFTAWVYAIAHYKLTDCLRRHSRRESIPLDETMELFTPDETEQRSAQRDVAHILSTLPEAQQQAIKLTRIEGLSTAEAAQRCGQSESLIKVNVHRGMKRLMAVYATSSQQA